MEGQISRRSRPPHLMCTTPFWGVAGALGCAYFAYLSYSRLRDLDFSWSHDWQSVLTGGVWILLLLGLIAETRCWRERTFFGLLFVNFSIAFALALWKRAPFDLMRQARKTTLALWILAMLASLLTLRPPERRTE
jgi:hypothetical protein